MIRIKDIRKGNQLSGYETSLTIGNFDGCHLGHQRLIESVIEAGTKRKLSTTVMTFDPAPEQFFKQEIGPSPRLFTTQQKERAFRERGVDIMIVESFDSQLAEMTHEQFFRSLIIEKAHTKNLVVGYDFKFGKARKGNAHYLALACTQAGIGFLEGQSVIHEHLPISSTRIRQGLTRGAVEECALMLGRPYVLEGVVGRGKQNGRKMGIHTANLSECSQLKPRIGVYAGYAFFEADCPIMSVPKSAVPAVINVGIRPTVSGTNEISIEAHCYENKFDDNELYDKPMALYFTNRLRDEMKFSGLEELKAAIEKDITAARVLIG